MLIEKNRYEDMLAAIYLLFENSVTIQLAYSKQS